jgi:hypothetical protein
VIAGKIKTLKVNKAKKATAGVERTVETAATEIEANHMTCGLIALHPMP